MVGSFIRAEFAGFGAAFRAGKQQLARLAELTEQDLQAIRAYEQTGRNGIKATRHDVKAIEYFLKEKLAATPLKNRAEWLHFALTSEDINSAAYAVLLADGLERVLLPALENLRRRLAALARREAAAPLLARTHGQAAVPTTFGKEVRVFESRLSEQLNQLKNGKYRLSLAEPWAITTPIMRPLAK